MRYAVRLLIAVSLLGLGLSHSHQARAQEATYEIGEGAFTLPIPEGWVKKQPRVRIVEAEFEAKPVEGDEIAGRVTVMGAGGSIDDNIARWCGQFTQPDGANTREKAKIKKMTAAGNDVVVVDVAGTYDDKPGPFVQTPGVQRPNFRMLAAIIQTKKAGNYFIKLYGPEKTIAKHEAGFIKMIEGLKAK